MSARDFDDAISAEATGDGTWRVWVHIADVSAHVPPGSPVDREARNRGTSVYVPGAVEPMLPAALSSVACSLVPGQDRPAVTVEMELRGAGFDSFVDKGPVLHKVQIGPFETRDEAVKMRARLEAA